MLNSRTLWCKIIKLSKAINSIRLQISQLSNRISENFNSIEDNAGRLDTIETEILANAEAIENIIHPPVTSPRGTITKLGNFLITTPLAPNEWFHLNFPKLDTDVGEGESGSNMFYLRVVGYMYGSGIPIEILSVGYEYDVTGNFNNVTTHVLNDDGKIQAEIYKATDNTVTLRFRPIGGTSSYYTNFDVLSTYVGNGLVLQDGDVTLTVTDTNL